MKKALVTLALLVSPPAFAEGEAFVELKSLTPEVAYRMAEAAMISCRDAGYQVGVTVVDRSGVPQVFIRDRFAGPHVFETSRRKAWTSISFRTGTGELDEATRPGTASAGIRMISEALPLGGGLPVMEGAGSMVAGIGVSGAPSPQADEVCAEAGIAAIEDDISF